MSALSKLHELWVEHFLENRLLGIDYGPVSSCDQPTGPNLVHATIAARDQAQRQQMALPEDQL